MTRFSRAVYQLIVIGLSTFMTSCSTWTNEVMESQYQFPIVPDPTYNFKRQGQSSVNILEAERARTASDVLYNRFLRTSYILNSKSWNELNRLFRDGGNNEIALEPILGTSPLAKNNQEAIRKDLSRNLEDVATAGGFVDGSYSRELHSRKAQALQSGFIGYNLGDDDRVYALSSGRVPAEEYKGMILGAVFLDKALGEYLNADELQNTELIQRHEDQKLITGRNYTELEHHWDLAYGYYKQIQKPILSSNLPYFRGSELKLEQLFALGRLAITEYRYQEAISHLKDIRELLSQVVAARAIYELTGPNTLANLKEDRITAFRFISRGLGLVYALQFTRKREGESYLSYAQVAELMKSITQDPKGLWSEQLESNLNKLSNEIRAIYKLR